MTADASVPTQSPLSGPCGDLLHELEDIHADPGLSVQGHRTAGTAAAWLKKRGHEVTEGVVGTGVVGLLRNGNGALMRKVVAAIEEQSGPDRVHAIDPAMASEDSGPSGAAWDRPAVFRMVGGTDPDRLEAAGQAGRLDAIPASHAPDVAPAIHPALRSRVEARLAAAGARLAAGAATP